MVDDIYLESIVTSCDRISIGYTSRDGIYVAVRRDPRKNQTRRKPQRLTQLTVADLHALNSV